MDNPGSHSRKKNVPVQLAAQQRAHRLDEFFIALRTAIVADRSLKFFLAPKKFQDALAMTFCIWIVTNQ